MKPKTEYNLFIIYGSFIEVVRFCVPILTEIYCYLNPPSFSVWWIRIYYLPWIFMIIPWINNKILRSWKVRLEREAKERKENLEKIEAGLSVLEKIVEKQKSEADSK